MQRENPSLRISEYSFDRFKSTLFLSALCLCWSSLQLSLEVIVGHRHILMKTCWADNSFLAKCHICTNLDAQKVPVVFDLET